MKPRTTRSETTITTEPRRRARERLLRLGAVCAAGALSAASGCGETPAAGDVEAKTSALHSSAFGPGGWSNSTFVTDLNTDPAICTNLFGYYLIVGLHPYDHTYYAGIQVPLLDDADLPPWAQFKAATPTFSSAPSCAFEAPFRTKTFQSPPSNKFFIAGKGTDNKIYVISGHQDDVEVQTPPAPAADGNWGTVPASNAPTYAGNYGRPAVWSNGTNAVLTFLTSDGKIHAYVRGIPFSTHSWGGIKDGPALPSGVTSDGIPAITYVRGPSNAAINKFVVLVQGLYQRAPGLYWTTFDGTNFSSSWTKATIPAGISVDSDPAAEYDDQSDALTVYFKSAVYDQATIVQTSVHNPTQIGTSGYDFYEIDHSDDYPYDPFLVHAPRVVFGGTTDEGQVHPIRALITWGYNGATQPQDDFATIMTISDHHYAPIATAAVPYDTVELPLGSAVCADHSQEEDFNNGVVGCAGQVSYANRATLCAPGSRPCTAAEYTAALGSFTPQYDYWVDDNLNHRAGTGSGACYATTANTGVACPSGTPMHVCTPNGNGADPMGNTCYQVNCGLYNNTNKYFGGCNGATAGTLCCLAVP